MKKYFLFGSTAVAKLYCLEAGDDEAEALREEDFAVYLWDEFSTPNELLYEFSGWGDYMEISEELYNKLLEL